MTRSMPKKADIVKYWLPILIESEKYWMDFYYDCGIKENGNVCFACGTEGIVERCHIIPKQKGGSDIVSNIHLLCRECHMESEIFTHEEIYNTWFNFKNSTNSGSRVRQYNQAIIQIIGNIHEEVQP
jgi:hypothetical protein